MTVFCRASLNYAAPSSSGSAVEVEIHDARTADLPGWRDCGFELVRHESMVADWTDDTQIAAVHYREIEELARRLTACDHAVVSDHVKRRADAIRAEREQAPVRLVHSDFAGNYSDTVRSSYRNVRGRGAAALARNGLTADTIEQAGRVVMLQFWRNLGPARMDHPVAFCDSRTVTPAEVQPFRYQGYVAGGRAFDALAVLAPERPSHHAWYVYPDLTPSEVVVFRTYDTELVDRNETWFTPHSAFRDPTVADGQGWRFSIELRAMCLFD